METHRISPDRAGDYLELFDGAFGDNPHWAGCYCQFYDDQATDEEWDPSDAEFGARNREKRMATIEAGGAHGLLAYDQGTPVGWINAGPRDSYANLRIFAEAIADDDPRIGSIMCFVIHPHHRSRGVATALLEAAHPYLRSLGVEVAGAYPRTVPPSQPDFPWTAAYYKGSPSMYEKAGYVLHREFVRFVAMRKPL